MIDAEYLNVRDVPIGKLLPNVEILKVLEDGVGINVKFSMNLRVCTWKSNVRYQTCFTQKENSE